MSTLAWLFVASLLMSGIALIGSVTLLLQQATLQRILLPLVALAAGSMLGGALFHMIPAALLGMPIAHVSATVTEPARRASGLLRISSSSATACTTSSAGSRSGGVFLIDLRVGFAAWLAAAAHEVPQELGDFAALLHGGWTKRTALVFNFPG